VVQVEVEMEPDIQDILTLMKMDMQILVAVAVELTFLQKVLVADQV
jgi:hypothetical protein